MFWLTQRGSPHQFSDIATPSPALHAARVHSNTGRGTRRRRETRLTVSIPPAMSATGLHLKPIVLAPVRPRQAADTDFTPRIPNPIPLGLYESVYATRPPTREGSIPPLAYFCLRALANYADQVNGIGPHRIRYQSEVLRTLSPSTFRDTRATVQCLCKLDPRIWSIITQVYSDLPKGLQNYYIPLGDRHLPLLQTIPPTPSFALVTVLNLAGRVSDETSHALKFLHGLCALDISGTAISHLGIRHFAPTATMEPSGGTRGLRILRLNNCRKITNQVFNALSTFPLLTVLGSYHYLFYYQSTHTNSDLRGAGCTNDLNSDVFRPSEESRRHLFLCSLRDALQRLKDADSHNILFSHPDPFVIHINREFHPRWQHRPDYPKPAPTPNVPALLHQPHHQGPLIVKAEQELQGWIYSILGNAANETRISEITDFVVQRWEYNPKRLESNGSYRLDSALLCGDDDPVVPWDEDDLINSSGEDSSTQSSTNFCGYEVNEDLMEKVWELVDEVREEHESATRFYGLDSQTPKVAFCYCRELRAAPMSLAETMPIDQDRMLVRDPPPWGSVYGSNPLPPRRRVHITKPSLSDSSNLNPDRSSMRAKKSTQEMLGMITQRKNLTTVTASHFPSTPIISRNPFKKSPIGSLALGELQHNHQGHEGSTLGGNSDCAPGGPTPKRMKSISQIPIPPRPIPALSQSTRVRSVGVSGKRLKQTTLSEAFGKRT